MDDGMTGTIDGTTAGGVPWHQVPRVARGTITAGTRTVVLAPGHPVSFGRSPSARLRIGHGPVCDEVVPDLAGEVFVHDGRVVVANLHDTLALDIRIPRRPLLSVPPGDWHAPVDRAYAVLVTGTFTYELAVTVGTGGGARRGDRGCTGDGGQRRVARPRLTDRQRRILDAYVAPLAEGGTAAASHQQVADAVGISRSLVRLECHRIWREMLVAGVPMRTLGDLRDEVADAWARHRL